MRLAYNSEAKPHTYFNVGTIFSSKTYEHEKICTLANNPPSGRVEFYNNGLILWLHVHTTLSVDPGEGESKP